MGNFSGCCQTREKDPIDYTALEFERKFKERNLKNPQKSSILSLV